MLQLAEKLDVSRCHGCGLCALVCPVYQHGGSVLKTPHGLAKQLQAGAGFDHNDAMACILCGACAPACPQNIDLMQVLFAFRQAANELGVLEANDQQPNKLTGVVFVADENLQKEPQQLDRVLRCLGNKVTLALDSGQDISDALREGRPVSHARRNQLTQSLASATKVICSDGLLLTWLRVKLPQVPVYSLGSWLSGMDNIKRQLNEHDLYIMEPAAYHASYEQAVRHYDQLQKTSGCYLARDLHRLAQPVGAQATNGFDQQRQLDWLLQGNEVKRIVAESMADIAVIKHRTAIPVIHVAELLS